MAPAGRRRRIETPHLDAEQVVRRLVGAAPRGFGAMQCNFRVVASLSACNRPRRGRAGVVVLTVSRCVPNAREFASAAAPKAHESQWWVTGQANQFGSSHPKLAGLRVLVLGLFGKAPKGQRGLSIRVRASGRKALASWRESNKVPLVTLYSSRNRLPATVLSPSTVRDHTTSALNLSAPPDPTVAAKAATCNRQA